MRYRGRYREPRTSLHVLNLIILALVLLGILVVGQRAAEFMSEAFVDITVLPEEQEGDEPTTQPVAQAALVRVAYAINEARRAAREAAAELGIDGPGPNGMRQPHPPEAEPPDSDQEPPHTPSEAAREQADRPSDSAEEHPEGEP